ncbi:glycoside hydrolase family 113 [Cyclobacterium qasimii]|nr:hypothetical protein [Cyclobacterium qasimii]
MMQFKLNNGYLWLVLLLGVMGLSSCESNKKLASFEGVKHKGVCWVGSRKPLQGGELRSLQNLGVSHLSQTPFGWQKSVTAPELSWEKDREKSWWGESSNGLISTSDTASSLGLTNILKPHIWVRGSWPGEIEMTNEKDWNLWFENYRGFILYYARIAERQGIPILCIGTEFEKASHKEKEWREIISAIREVYNGKLTYAANFTEYQKVNFWDALDYIGIQAYFPLVKNDKVPDLAQLIEGWEKVIPEIEKTNRIFQKPVIFTEIGYCNTEDAAQSPWVWPNERHASTLSEEVQALCYEAFFEAVWEKPWMQGVYFWKWYPQPSGREPDFTPQNKMAEKVMKKYFLDPNMTDG